MLCRLECNSNIHSHTEEPFGQRLALHTLCAIGILLEILKVAAPVEDIELPFVLPVAEDSW